MNWQLYNRLELQFAEAEALAMRLRAELEDTRRQLESARAWAVLSESELAHHLEVCDAID